MIPIEAETDNYFLSGSGGGLGTGGLALAYQCQQSGRVRACGESILVLSLMKKLSSLLEAEDVMSAFTKVLYVLLLPSSYMQLLEILIELMKELNNITT